uniref:non-specific serine/threonine protein kinase n=1 Tax=Leersia perrieri TaxID=77586 RepID=A0A0D9X774_9ORYZ
MPRFHHILKTFFNALIIAEVVLGQTEREVLLELKNFLQVQNPINHGGYNNWLESKTSPCQWQGVSCDASGRVNFLDLSNSNISGPAFQNFSRLNRLTHLDLSANSIIGELQDDLKNCLHLQYLNLSYKLISGTLDVSSLTNLQTLDLSQNRFQGSIRANFPAICRNLSAINLSNNNLTGSVSGLFNNCLKLQDVDLSWNNFTGKIWNGIARLRQFRAAKNNFTGRISSRIFSVGCKLQSLDLASNQFNGNFPSSIGNCAGLTYLSIWDNDFSGSIPPGIGSIPGLEELVLASNRFNREIPLELVNCTSLKYLDISDNNFGWEVQQVLGKLTSLTNLVLQENNYSGGIVSSGILRLPKLALLDLSFNKFNGKLPLEISSLGSIKALMLAENNFSGTIPPSYGQLLNLQALDLSYNSLSGEIPPSIGNMTSLLLLMLAGNQLSGEIPREIGNCSSLLWLNLVGNRLSGQIPPEMARMGSNPSSTFAKNQKNPSLMKSVTNKCLAVYRWVPSSYPEFDYVQSMMLSQKNCRTIWNRLMMGYDILPASSPLRTALGFVQLSGNLLAGQIPSAIGDMKNISLLLLDGNRLSGHLPSEIGLLQLVALNASNNYISGEIPVEIGNLGSLESLDLSCNNFSGALPSSLEKLSKLSEFNVSYNPLLTGRPRPRNGTQVSGTEDYPTKEDIIPVFELFAICLHSLLSIFSTCSVVFPILRMDHHCREALATREDRGRVDEVTSYYLGRSKIQDVNITNLERKGLIASGFARISLDGEHFIIAGLRLPGSYLMQKILAKYDLELPQLGPPPSFGWWFLSGAVSTTRWSWLPIPPEGHALRTTKAVPKFLQAPKFKLDGTQKMCHNLFRIIATTFSMRDVIEVFLMLGVWPLALNWGSASTKMRNASTAFV